MPHKFRIVAGKLLANEEPIVRQITDGLNLARLAWYRIRERIPGEGALSQAGIPDLCGWVSVQLMILKQMGGDIRHSLPFFIEVKRMGRHKKRDAQIQFIERAKHDGCIAFFAQGWDDCVREFRTFGIHLPNG